MLAKFAAILLTLLVALGCSGPDDSPELDPVFVVMCPDIDPGEEPHPCCTGFALGAQVVTAIHCVPGDAAQLVSNRQWLDTASASQIGTVISRDDSRDIAWLSAKLDGPGLRLGAVVHPADAIRVLTRSGVKLGTASERIGSVRWIK